MITSVPNFPPIKSSSQPAVRSAGFMTGAWRRFRRNRLALFGLVYVIILLMTGVFAPWIAPYPYDKIDPNSALIGPTWQHPMGVDMLGRDMLSRIIYGARPMLLVGVLTQLIGLIFGVPLGIISGYMGGFVDWIISRLIDLFSALPWYLIVLYMVMVLSPSLQNLIIALSITSWVASCRIVRGMSMSLREQEYIEAAIALGIPSWRVQTHHIFPQAAPLLIWSFAAGIPTAVFAEAGLSFIGMGVRPPNPSWGQMLGQAGQYWQYFPHIFVFPALMITLSVLAFQGLADGLREAMDVNVNV
jgi:oligopeptide transport system permease protein